MTEIELIEKFILWFESHFKDSEIVFEKEVQLFLGSEPQKFRVDLVVIQSKSNVIHSIELKTKINLNILNSIVWQVDSLYGNYKWLVVGDLIPKDLSIKKLIKEKGIGLIFYNREKETFTIEIQPKYIDGNLLDYYPTLKQKWSNKQQYGSHNRSKEKN